MIMIINYFTLFRRNKKWKIIIIIIININNFDGDSRINPDRYHTSQQQQFKGIITKWNCQICEWAPRTYLTLIWAYGYALRWQTFPGNIMIMIRLSPVVESGLSDPWTILALTNNCRPSNPKPTPPTLPVNFIKGWKWSITMYKSKPLGIINFLDHKQLKAIFFQPIRK